MITTSDSIFQACTSPTMTALRREIFSTAPKSGPCQTCPGVDPQEALAAALADPISQQISRSVEAA